MTQEEFNGLIELYNDNYHNSMKLRELYKFIKVMYTQRLLGSEDEEITDEEIDTYLADTEKFSVESFNQYLNEFYVQPGIKNPSFTGKDIVDLLKIARNRIRLEETAVNVELEDELAKWEKKEDVPVGTDDTEPTEDPLPDPNADPDSGVEVNTDGDGSGSNTDPSQDDDSDDQLDTGYGN